MSLTTEVINGTRQRSQCCDADLIRATRAGDPAAFGELYRRHVDECTRFARRRCRDRHLADDVVSEVFAATLQAITNGHGPTDDLAPYVMRSIGHQIARACTRGDGGRAVPTDPGDLGAAGGAAADRLGLHEDQVVTTQAFRRLSDRYRQVLWATEVEECSHADLGARLGLREPAVAALARRARQAFANAYLDVRTNPTTHDPRCAGVRRTLASYVRESVCDSTRTKIDEHLDQCAECADVVAGMRQLSTSLRAVPWLAPAGAIGMSRWALVAHKVGLTAGALEVPKILATGALGLSLLVAPTASIERSGANATIDSPAPGVLDRLDGAPDGLTRPNEARHDRVDRLDLDGHDRSAADPVTEPTAGALDRSGGDLLDTPADDQPGNGGPAGDVHHEAGEGAGGSDLDAGAAAIGDRSPGERHDRHGTGEASNDAPDGGSSSPGDATPPAPPPAPTPPGEGSGGVSIDVLDGTASVGALTSDGLLTVDVLDGTVNSGVLTSDGALTLDVLDGTLGVGALTPQGPLQVEVGGNGVGEIVEDTVGQATDTVDELLDTAGGLVGQAGDAVSGLTGGLLGGLFGG